MSRPITIVEQNNTVEIVDDVPAPPPPKAWYSDLVTIPASSAFATVTADSTPHVKGAWTEIIPGNAATTTALFVKVTGVSVSSTNTAMLLDIGTGDAGVETVIASNIGIGGAALVYFVLPVRVESLTRIAARVQALIPSDTATVEISSLTLGNVSVVDTTVDILGGDVATSEGIFIYGASTWNEVTASTTQEYKAVGLVPSQSTTNHPQNHDVTMEIGIGVPGGETTIHEQLVYFAASESVTSRGVSSFISAATIPVGSRLSVRVDQSYEKNVVIIGVPAV